MFYDFTIACAEQAVATVGAARCGDPAGSGITLTTDMDQLAGAAWLIQAYDASTIAGFSLELTLSSMMVEKAGDGFAIVLQADPRNVLAIGGPGRQLGYGTATPIAPSVALEIDTNADVGGFEPHVRFDFDGNVVIDDPAGDVPLPAVPITSGQPFTVWLDYDGSSLMAYLAQHAPKPASAMISAPIDLRRLGTQMRMGVTAGNGMQIGIQRLLRLSVDVRL